jgi:hypothetical protein
MFARLRQRRRELRTIRRLRRERDAFVVSFPKSGRTWHRVMLGAYLGLRHGLDLRGAIEPAELAAGLGLPRVGYEHNGANFLGETGPDDPSVADHRLWRGRRVLFLLRAPEDLLVSAYHHARFRARVFDGPISEFIRQPATGAEKVAASWARWAARMNEAEAAKVQTYEWLHDDAEAALAETVRFFELGEPDPESLREAVAFSRFDNLRSKERSGFFGSDRLAAGPGEDDRALKTREGKVGGWRAHLSEEDRGFIWQAFERRDSAFAELYRPSRGERTGPAVAAARAAGAGAAPHPR